MKKSTLLFFSLSFSVVFLSNIKVDNIKTFVMTAVGTAPILPENPFDYSDIPFPDHLFSDSIDIEIGYGRGGPPDPDAFESITDHGATLGRVLFYDKKLSAVEDISCASCHHQELSFTENKDFSEGVNSLTKRNSMHLNDLLWTNSEHFTWDMREKDIHNMIILPLTDENEIGANIEEVNMKLSNTDYYPTLFANAYGDPQITEERIVDALVQFITSMTTFESKFDQGIKNNFSDFSLSELHGLELFGEHCASCHVQGKHTLFGGEIFGEDILEVFPFIFNNGLPVDPDDAGVGEWNQNGLSDLFKVPTLRNIELTGPYMHDGRFMTLEEVVDHYSDDIVSNQWSSFFIPLDGFQYTDEQKVNLVNFLKTLTDDSFISNPKWSDPFGTVLDDGEELTLNIVSLSPNPMLSFSTIKFENPNFETTSINVISQDGRLVKHERTTQNYYQLDKNDFHEGVYFVHIIMGDKKATQKLMVN